MTKKEIADELRREKPLPARIADWVRRHFVINIGKHGEKSVDIGIRLDF